MIIVIKTAFKKKISQTIVHGVKRNTINTVWHCSQ